MVIDDLYNQPPCSHCGGLHNSADIVFDENILEQVMKSIYDGFNVQDDIQPEMFQEIASKLNLGISEGFSMGAEIDMYKEFFNELKSNTDVFSAFKVHRAQNDMAAKLIDDNGDLRSFDAWKKEIEPIASHQVGSWFKTEYDTAVTRAHQAADWKQFEANKDILPNLRWMPTTSLDPEPIHQKYWMAKTTLPVDDHFWSNHHPGDRWNCKCYLEATDEDINNINAVNDQSSGQPGLDGNPGVDGKIFSDSHPYIKNAYQGADEAVNNFLNKKKN